MNVTASYGIIINLCAVKFIAFYQNGQLLCCHQIMLVHFPVVLSGHCHASTTVIQVVLNFITRTINQAMFLIVPICFKQIDQIDQWLNKKYTTNLCLQWRSTQTPFFAMAVLQFLNQKLENLQYGVSWWNYFLSLLFSLSIWHFLSLFYSLSIPPYKKKKKWVGALQFMVRRINSFLLDS